MTDTNPRKRARAAIENAASSDPYAAYRLLTDETGPDLLGIAHALRADADRIEKAHWMLEEGTWTRTEAAIFIAQTTTQGGYDTDSELIATHDLAPPADT